MVSITLFGSTGLIGNEILKLLEEDVYFKSINVVSRRKVKLKSKRSKLKLIDFSNYDEYLSAVENSDIVLAAIGTTQSKVNFNKKKYIDIDLGIVSKIAKACKEKRVKHFSFVSSTGANVKNKSFYLKLKGQIEEEVKSYKLNSSSVYRPSLLIGRRSESRYGEQLAQIIIPLISFLMPSDYKPIKAFKVAKAMVNESKKYNSGFKIFHYDQILNLS